MASPATSAVTIAGTLPAGGARDSRIDLIRGLCLLTIFFDHIPHNCFSKVTLQCFGFSDAAELFVFLAGYSSVLAYERAFRQGGLRAGFGRILRRCLRIWGAHAGLLLTTIGILSLRQAAFGLRPTLMAPLMRDGLQGVLRGLTLAALPSYLDILPLYIVFLLLFPLIHLGMRTSTTATLLASVAIYLAANATHYNLPNAIDPRVVATWSFNPFTWQLIYVVGMAFARAYRSRQSWLHRPPRLLLVACWSYLLFAFAATNGWRLWPSIFMDDNVAGLFGNEPKCFLTPWRLVHAIALITVLLTSPWFSRLSARPNLAPIVACGRHSLAIFSAGCVLALLGRLAFLDLGPTGFVQVLVNVSGLMVMLLLAAALDARAGGWRANDVAIDAKQGASACALS